MPSVGRLSLSVGVVTGILAAIGGFMSASLGTVLILLFVGMASIFFWVLAAVLVAKYLSSFSRRDMVTSLAVTFGFLISLAPGIFLASLVGVLASVVIFAGVVMAIRQVATEWEASKSEVSFFHVLGASAIWLFAIRYFFLSISGPLMSGNVGMAILDTIQNVLWLVQIAPTGIRFDYSRLMLVGFIALLVGVYVASEVIVKSPYGRVLKAIREDQQVAASLGKDTFTYKVQSMALGSAIAGLAGGLTAIFFRTLTYQMFHPRVTFFVMLIVIIGGMANNRGMILGAIVYWGFQQGTTDIAALFPSGGMRTRVQAIRLALFGLGFVALLYYRPEGLLPERKTVKESETND